MFSTISLSRTCVTLFYQFEIGQSLEQHALVLLHSLVDGQIDVTFDHLFYDYLVNRRRLEIKHMKLLCDRVHERD